MGETLQGAFARRAGWFGAALLAAALAVGPAAAADPIKIGFSMAQTGPLAGSGKSALLAMKIWAEDVNAKGGLLGRPVQLIYYDDQSNPSNVPSIYTKLLDIDKVDLINSGYATPIIAAAMPIAMQHDMVLMGLFGLANNAKLKYDKYFSMVPIGEDPTGNYAPYVNPTFDLAEKMNPKPSTVAVITPDIQFGHSILDGVRAAAKERGMKLVYDRTFPTSTTDLTTVVREVQSASPDIVIIGTQPGQTINVVRAISEVGLKAMLVGGSMTGLQTTDAETILGPQLNGFVSVGYWLPAPKLQFQGSMEFLAKYQARAKAEGVDPVGYYVAPFAYADLQILGDAVEATKSLEGDKLGPYIHATTFHTVVGDVAFGPGGEWAKQRLVMLQFQNVTNKDVGQFIGTDHVVVVAPDDLKSGELVYPFEKARQ
jgi:branched-chain amino acid transport system substrate-binding protein